MRQFISLRVRSDNLGALSLLISLKGAASTGPLAKELALDLAETPYHPHMAAHTPGVTNKVADHLSRAFDKSISGWQLPAELSEIRRAYPDNRVATWWKFLRASSATGGGVGALEE